MAQPRLSPNEMHALMQAAAPTSGRTAEAAAGGGGRRRGGGRRKGRSTSARPRLSRRERRAVNDALLHMSSPDARHMDAKAVFDLRHRQPVAWTVLREHKSHSVPTTSTSAAGGGAVTPRTHVAQMRVTRRIRALVKSKGTFVRPILLSVEEPIRAAAHDGSTVALPLADSLSRLLAHAVAQFYGFMHRSERRGGDYFVHVQPPQPVIVPKRRLCDLIASS